MRPITLKIRGLNSYKDEQAIDFSALTADGIFGIFGPTGSGKTTVIDAMTMALYGCMPRHGANNMECVNAGSPGIYIYFKFSYDDGDYVIERTYKRKLSSENRYIAGDSEARLYRVYNGSDKRPVASGDKVTKWVEQQTGLNYENFTRIVVLPQGEFDALLKLKGSEAGKMLQDIFRLRRFGEALIKNIRIRLDAAGAQIDNLQKLIAQFPDCTEEHLAAKRAELAETEDSLKETQNRLGAVERRRKLASRLADCYKRQSENAGQLSAARAYTERKRAAVEAAERGLKEAGEAYERAKSLKDARFEPLIGDITKLESGIGAIKTLEAEIDGLLKEYKQTELEVIRGAAEKERAESGLRRLEADLQDLERGISEAETPGAVRSAVSDAFYRYKSLEEITGDIAKKAELLDKERLALDALERGKAEADTELMSAGGTLEALNWRYENLLKNDPNRKDGDADKLARLEQRLHEARLNADAALTLAGALRRGEPCPVCGSAEHPSPVRPGGADALIAAVQRDIRQLQSDIALYEGDKKKLEADIKKAARALDEARQNASRQESAVGVRAAARANYEADIAGLESRRADIARQIKESTYGGLLESLNIESLAQAAFQLNMISQKDKRRGELLAEQKAKKSGFAELTARYDAVGKACIEREKELEGVKARGKEKRAGLEREKAALAALAGDEEPGAFLARLKSERDGLVKAEETLRSKLQGQREGLESDRQELSNLRGREGQLAAAKTQIENELTVILAADGCPPCPPDQAESLLKTLEGQADALSASLNEARERLGNLKADVSGVEQNLKKLEGWRGELKESNRRAAMLDELSKTVGANKFARFLGLRQLDYVVRQASAQLMRITGGRFEIEFSDSEKGNVFLIRDNSEGGARRSPKTLSGGETFIVSICLALALSRKLQLSSRAPLEFFFLDEGFGNLDHDMRRAAIGFLKGLIAQRPAARTVSAQSIRAPEAQRLSIGIITHVEELKEMMPVWLTVTPPDGPRSGSRVTIENM